MTIPCNTSRAPRGMLRRPNPTYAPFDTIDDAILAAVARLAYLTSRQLCTRFWQPTSLTAMRAKTKELADLGYLERVLLRRTARAGAAPVAYTLGAAGRRRLRWLGVPLGRTRPSENREKSELFVPHTLALNDVLLRAERLGVGDARIRLAGFRHEREFKCTPLVSAAGTVIPDGWLEFHVAEGERWVRDCFLIEVDRGTEGMRVLRQKIARLLMLDMQAYARLLGTASFSGFLLVAPNDPGRLGLLRTWIEDELALHGRQDAADLFYLTAMDAAAVTPTSYFLGAHWLQPFSESRVAVLCSS